MTRIVTIRSRPCPRKEAWNACVVPWKPPLRVTGSPSERSSAVIRLTASPSETPGFRLKEIVKAGRTPRWFTVRGPVPRVIRATVLSGTSRPPAERT